MITDLHRGILVEQGPGAVTRGDSRRPENTVVALVAEFHPMWVDPDANTYGCNEILGVSSMPEDRALAMLRRSFWLAIGRKDADLIDFLRQKYALPLPFPEVEQFDLQFAEVSHLIYVGAVRDADGRIHSDVPVSWWDIHSVTDIVTDYVTRAS